MPDGGVVITVRNEDVLPLYLAYGVYGKKLRLGTDDDPNPESYVRTLAEYAACRQGDHVFFRCRGRFYYGGRVLGSASHGAFYINGRRGLLGKRAEAPIVWDESRWNRFEPPAREGLDSASRPPVCQPFLLRFRDWMQFRGRWIDEDAFYFALRDYNHLLPTTWMTSNMVSTSPGETEVLLDGLMREPGGELSPVVGRDVDFAEEPIAYDPSYGPDLSGARSREDLLAAALADPSQLPGRVRPDGSAIGHRVPVTPHRPRDVESADVGYYSDRRLRDGTLPDVLVYLDAEPAGAETGRRIERQHRWLTSLLGDDVRDVEFYAVAPAFDDSFGDSLRERTVDSIETVQVTIDGSGL